MEQPLYMGSTLWLDDVRKARANWKVVVEERLPVADAEIPGHEIVFVEAEAGTGSRYVVVATPLGTLGRGRAGGPALVTVLAPWEDAWPLQWGGHLALSYVAEHLTDGRYRNDRLNGGDAAALTLTVAYALGRYEDAVLDA